jgi:hypothetical protein
MWPQASEYTGTVKYVNSLYEVYMTFRKFFVKVMVI